MKIIRNIIILLVLLSSVRCGGTFEELLNANGIRWNPKFAVPIINSSFTFDDLIAEVDSSGFVEIGQDNLITLVYNSQVVTSSAESFYFIPNQSFTEDLPVPDIPVFPDGQEVSSSVPLQLNFDVLDYIVDSALLKSGELDLEIVTDVSADIEVGVRIPSLRSGGNEVTSTLVSAFGGNTSPRTSNVTIDLANTLVDLTTDGQNVFSLELEILLTGKGMPLSSSDDITFNLDITTPQYRRIHGTLPSLPIQQRPDTLPITFFNNIDNGRFGVSDPSINFSFNNGFGIPLDIDMSRIKVRKGITEVVIDGAVTDQPVALSAPETIAEQAANTMVLLNKDNSNLPSMIDILPDEFIYQFSGTLNPQNRSGLFIWDTSRVNIDYDIKVPLFGWVDNMSLTRDYDFDGSLLDDTENVAFKIKTDNELPLSMILQIYFLDNQRNIVDSLLTENAEVILAAETDDQGRSEGSELAENIFTLDDDKIANARNSEFIRVLVRVNSDEREIRKPVQILASNRFDLRISMQTNVDLDI